jgi:hypothetical protein
VRRRQFLGVLGGGRAITETVRAQTPGRVYRIGFLVAVSRRLSHKLIE